MRTLLYMGLAVMTLMGCSKEAAGDAAPATDAGAPPAADATPPAKDDACGLLTLGEVRRVVPQASRSKRNDNLTKYGINACEWYSDTSKAPVLEASVWEVTGADDTPMSNAQTLAMGIADPLRAGAQAAVRLEKVAGVGEEAVVIVEKSDAARGIMTNGALLTLRKNGRIATVSSGYVALDDRPKAIEQLASLGKSAASRL